MEANLEEWLSSEAWKYQKAEYEEALLSLVSSITETTVTSIEFFFIREQAIGELRQVKNLLTAHEERLAEIKQLLKQHDYNQADGDDS